MRIEGWPPGPRGTTSSLIPSFKNVTVFTQIRFVFKMFKNFFVKVGSKAFKTLKANNELTEYTNVYFNILSPEIK